VSSYQVKRSPGWFVSPKQAVLRGALALFKEDNSLRGENTVAESNPARVLSRQSEDIEFQIFKIYQLLLSIVPHTHDGLH
jgi:hypothetical protein